MPRKKQPAPQPQQYGTKVGIPNLQDETDDDGYVGGTNPDTLYTDFARTAAADETRPFRTSASSASLGGPNQDDSLEEDDVGLLSRIPKIKHPSLKAFLSFLGNRGVYSIAVVAIGLSLYFKYSHDLDQWKKYYNDQGIEPKPKSSEVQAWAEEAAQILLIANFIKSLLFVSLYETCWLLKSVLAYWLTDVDHHPAQFTRADARKLQSIGGQTRLSDYQSVGKTGEGELTKDPRKGFLSFCFNQGLYSVYAAIAGLILYGNYVEHYKQNGGGNDDMQEDLIASKEANNEFIYNWILSLLFVGIYETVRVVAKLLIHVYQDPNESKATYTNKLQRTLQTHSGPQI